MKVIKIIACVYLCLVLGSLALGILGGLVGLTLGVFGAIFGIISKFIFHPAVIAVLAIYVVYKLFSRTSVKPQNPLI